MCYLIAKNDNGGSSLVLQTMHGQDLVKLKEQILADPPMEDFQLLTVSRPSAYSEYEPFYFMDDPESFTREIRNCIRGQ